MAACHAILTEIKSEVLDPISSAIPTMQGFYPMEAYNTSGFCTASLQFHSTLLLPSIDPIISLELVEDTTLAIQECINSILEKKAHLCGWKIWAVTEQMNFYLFSRIAGCLSRDLLEAAYNVKSKQ